MLNNRVYQYQWSLAHKMPLKAFIIIVALSVTKLLVRKLLALLLVLSSSINAAIIREPFLCFF